MRLALAIVVLALSAAAHAQMHKWTDKDGKVHYSDSPAPADARQQTTIAKSAGAGSPARASTGSVALDFEGNRDHPIQIVAKGAEAVRRGANIEVRLSSVQLWKSIAEPQVEYSSFAFRLSRVGARGEPEPVMGRSDEASSVRGKLTDLNHSATYHNVLLVWPGGAAECEEKCFVSLYTWVGYGNSQTGASSKRVELRFK